LKAPAFWWAAPSPAARLLQPLAAAYGAVAAARLRRPGARAAVPVICVGNFTAGGAGKTPTALALARLLKEAGHRPAFLTRGYGGRLAGPVRVGPGHGPDEVGDEPLLLARIAPTVVARERVAGAEACVRAGASVVVMDDGLQNPSLEKDLALAVVDGATGIGNGLCHPAGPLRAPLAAQWPRVHALVLVGRGAPGEALAAQARERGLPVLPARIVADAAVAARLDERRVLAFAGIGRPDKFFGTVADCGARIVERVAFPDHHPFTGEEIRDLLGRAARADLLPVTTEKDLVRIARLDPALAQEVAALPIAVAFEDDGPVRALLRRSAPLAA
jgi:tetraacyldisaccharide 4'-kinase